jgi:hypothetical protein
MAKTEISKQSLEEKTPEIQLIEAVLNVMSEVNYLQKDDTVGTGSGSYKGISDEKVRNEIRKSMITHGLICVPIKIEKETKHERWQELDPYSKTGAVKQKQQIFSDIVFTFRLYHTSGAHIEGQSSGHGIDSQDKSPGKAMTYAMKYFLLNIFMVPTGEDTDKIHSMDIETPKISPKTEVVTLPKPTVDVPERINPQYPTEEIIQTMLYGGDGAIMASHMDGILANWKKNGATLLYGKYIYTHLQGKFHYFIVDDIRREHIIKFAKHKHG